MPGALRTAPRLATAEDLEIGHPTALRGEASRSKVVVGNYCYGPITVVPCRAKLLPLLHASILVRPRTDPPSNDPTGRLVEAPGTAPGSAAPIPQKVYRHSRLPDALNIGALTG